jgi:hypothetical protein
MPSIGTATGSRVDSAAKHIMACKVDSRLLGRWLDNPNSSDPTSYMHTNKMKFCMHKDEIVLNTTKKKSNQDSSAKAYPMVVSTVGEMQPLTQLYIRSLYSCFTARDFFSIFDRGENAFTDSGDSNCSVHMPAEYNNGNKEIAFDQIRNLPEFRCQGVALGQAWASYMSGDTVASVLVGGMMTVLNGHFTMHTGDEVQWYFDFENDGFQHGNSVDLANGFRLSGLEGKGIEKSASSKRKKRDDFMDSRVFGTGGGYGKSMGMKNTRCVVRIKSYRMCKHENICFDHFGDKTRVFAKCISGGRPFDMVDIMLMTQSS